jgi:hypothetical protein
MSKFVELLGRLIPQNWNDCLSLVVIVGVPVLWAWQGLKGWTMPEDINGAMSIAWALVIQFYFRRAPEVKTPDITPTE